MNDEVNPYDKIVEDMRNQETEGDASFLARIFSLIIDLTILTFVTSLLGSTSGASEGSIGFSLDTTGVLVFILYYLLLEWSPLKGTIGKFLLGIKVCDEYGARLSFSKSLLRCISRGVTFFTFFLGYLTILFRDDNRALHDFMSSTYVLNKNKNV